MRLSDIAPQFCIVIGGAGSGKNYFIEHNSTLSSFEIVDVDVLKKDIGVSAAISAVRPALIAAFEKGVDVVHPTTGSNIKAQQRKIALARQYGYTVTLILVDTPVDRAIKQVRDRYRAGGHDVDLDKIVSSNMLAREHFTTLSTLVDKTIVHKA